MEKVAIVFGLIIVALVASLMFSADIGSINRAKADDITRKSLQEEAGRTARRQMEMLEWKQSQDFQMMIQAWFVFMMPVFTICGGVVSLLFVSILIIAAYNSRKKPPVVFQMVSRDHYRVIDPEMSNDFFIVKNSMQEQVVLDTYANEGREVVVYEQQ